MRKGQAMPVPNAGARSGQDWARNWRAYLIAWGIPSAVLVAAGLLEPGPRAIAWTGVLVWMGAGCLMNARRCGRTHCRYTGPYYLLLTAPVLILGTGTASPGAWAWWILGATILLGSKAIWIVTEGLWGRYRP